MSCFAHAPSRPHAERIAENLDQLAADPALTPELRTLCRRLAQRWDAIASDLRETAPRIGAPAVH